MQDEYHIKKHGISTPFNTIDDVGADFQYNINIILKGAWTLKREEGWGMYIEIQQLKDMGLNISQIARHLGISRPTVYEYINMSPDEFDKRLNKMQERCKKPDCYLDEILYWLRNFLTSRRHRFMTGLKRNITHLILQRVLLETT